MTIGRGSETTLMLRCALGTWGTLICMACAMSAACNGGQTGTEQAPTEIKPNEVPAPSPPIPVAAAPAAAPDAIEDASFSLSLAAAGPYKAGELGRVVLHLTPKGEFHINQEFPIEIDVTGDADTSFPKAKLERPDAAEFGEKAAKFDVPFTSKAGSHKLLANVKFAVCTKENCVPDERNLALALAVN